MEKDDNDKPGKLAAPDQLDDLLSGRFHEPTNKLCRLQARTALQPNSPIKSVIASNDT